MMPLVVRVEDVTTGARSQAAFIKSPVRIGRSEINDLPLPFGFVSTWHALVRFDDHEAHYLDLGSTNGSMVDGQRLETNQPVAVQAGTTVAIGQLRLTFERRATGERPAVPQHATMFAMRVANLPPPPPPPEAHPEAAPAAAAAPALAAPPPIVLDLAGVLPEAPPALDIPDLAREVADAAVEAASLDLDLLYASWRGSWEHLRSHVEGVVAGMDAPSRAAALQRMAAKYAAVAGEPAFQAMAAGVPLTPGPAATFGAPLDLPPGLGAPPPGAAPGFPQGDAGSDRLIGAFAEAYLPASVKLSEADAPQQVLGRVADVLETFARSYVEMRKGYEEFGREMGVRTVLGQGSVERARDPKQLLAYLLDPGHPTRTRDLQGAFADLMVHQVALLNGVVDGAKALLSTLDPEAIQAASPGGIWPMKAQALWKEYESRFKELQEEDSAIEEKLFGREFAKAYTSMLGQRSDPNEPEPPDRDDDDEDDEEEEKPAAKGARPRRR